MCKEVIGYIDIEVQDLIEKMMALNQFQQKNEGKIMELRDALLKRRSVRKFKEDRIPDEYIEELMHAAMSGPSACNNVYKI